MENSDLAGARITESTYQDVNFDRAKLVGTNFLSSKMDRASFKDANLTTAIFGLYYGSSPGTSLVNADFSNANLQQAMFRDYTDLKQANFEGANLEAAIFIRVKNIAPSQIKSACNWELAYYNHDPQRNLLDLNLTEADRLASQQYIAQLKQDTASVPQKAIDCRKWD